jgi:hypothetical protein
MKLPSLQQVVQDATRTFLRFPVVLIFAAVGTFAAVMLIDHEGPPQATILFNVLLASILGIPMLLAFALIAEKKKWSRLLSIGVQILGVLLLAAYGFTIPADLGNAPAIYIIRQLMLAVALHLFVAFAPYLGKGEHNGFWHYNKTLFLRLFMAVIFASVLYTGLSIALAALDQLFGIYVPGKRYGELWCIIVGLFITWFFLAGIPEDLDSLENSTDYPRGIKIFAQSILFPLVLIYLVILYAYLIKIVVEWDWPQGWVSKLILGFSATGIFSLLLLYPVRERAENIWIRSVSRWFYIIMIPLLMMLFPAVWRRISEYGVTEGRYIAIALGLWLAGLVIYFMASKTKSIKVIPASLAALALIISWGPWGIFKVSEQSQVNRLKVLLTNNSILVEGKVRTAPAAVSAEDTKQISSIIAYLYNIHGYDCIQPWFDQSLKEDSGGTGAGRKAPAITAKMMGIEYLNIWYSPAESFIYLSSDQQSVIDVHDYDLMLRAQNVETGSLEKSFSGTDIVYCLSANLDTITFRRRSADQVIDSLQIDLRPLVDKMLQDYGNTNVSKISAEKMSVSKITAGMKVKVYLRYINLRRAEGVKIVDYMMDILYKYDYDAGDRDSGKS